MAALADTIRKMVSTVPIQVPVPISQWLSSPSNRKTAITAAVATTLLSAIVPGLYRDYRLYMSYGPGGLPQNVFGWIAGRILLLFKGDMFSTAVYDVHPNKESWLSEGFSQRRSGKPPTIARHPVPQRQLDQIPDPEIQQVGLGLFRSVKAILAKQSSNN